MIEEIHKRNLKGTFTEIGCGMPVSDALFEVDGASNTIIYAHSPYSKEEQERLYGTSTRSVSLEFVKNVMGKQIKNYPSSRLHFVSSFQVGDNKISHGWIGIYYDMGDQVNEEYFHLTFNKENFNHKFLRKHIKQELRVFGINLIFNRGVLTQDSRSKLYTVDSIDSTGENTFEDVVNIFNNPNGILYFNDGKLCRIEDYLRTQKELNLYKGSFSIPHIGHYGIANQFDNCLFVISVNTHEKGKVDTNNLLSRVKTLNDDGYQVAVILTPMFQDCINLFRYRGFEGQINMIMGRDTAERLISMNNYEPSDNVSFIYFDRHNGGPIENIHQIFKYKPYDVNISSTELRNAKG